MAQAHRDLGADIGRLNDAGGPVHGAPKQPYVGQRPGLPDIELPSCPLPRAGAECRLAQRQVDLSGVRLHVQRQFGPVGGQVRGGGDTQPADVTLVDDPGYRVGRAEMLEGERREAADAVRGGEPCRLREAVRIQGMPRGQRAAPDRLGACGGGRRHLVGLVAGERLGVVRIVGEGDADFEFHILVARGGRVGARRGACNGRSSPEPLVGVAGACQPIGVLDVRCRGRKRHAHLRRTR